MSEAGGDSSDDDARQMTLSQLTAELRSGRRVADRPRLNTVIDAFVAEVGTNRHRVQVAEQIRIASLDASPFLARHSLATHRTELKPHPSRFPRLGRSFRRFRSCRMRIARRRARCLFRPSGRDRRSRVGARHYR